MARAASRIAREASLNCPHPTIASARMTRFFLRIAVPIFLAAVARAELRVPAFTAYLEPERGARISSKSGVAEWRSGDTHVVWFGEIKQAGKLEAAVAVRVPEKTAAKFKLTVAGQVHEA